MTNRWLDIIGIGEGGVAGLSADALQRLEEAEIIIGGDRHHSLTPNVKARRLSWPSPFDAMIDEIRSHKGKRLVVLVTGDPLWFSVGARITKGIAADEIRFHPQLSAFQLAACRMGWSLADCEQLTIHGRPAEQIVPYFAPNACLLVLTKDSSSPADVAKLLSARGFGQSKLTVLAAMGGANEARFEGVAANWADAVSGFVPDFHLLAVECIGRPECFSRAAGLPDDAFEHDGQMTKRVARAATLSALQPFPDALLWDIGAGCGSIAIEWMRLARGAKAIAIEPNNDRITMMQNNAINLGVPALKIVNATAPDGLDGLPVPDAVFIGGGLTDGVFDKAWAALVPGGFLVANAVTLESENLLADLHKTHGGTLDKISVSSAINVGRYRGMKPSMAVTQWAVQKPIETDQ